MKKSDQEQLAEEVLRFIQQDLAREYRYLTSVFYYLILISDPGEESMSTDSRHLFYNTEYILREFMGKQKQYRALKYRYLHLTLHCLAGHVRKREQTDRILFDSCADLYAAVMLKKLTGKSPPVPRDYAKLLSAMGRETGNRSLLQFMHWCRKDSQRSLDMLRLGKILKSDNHDQWMAERPLTKQMERAGDWTIAADNDWEYLRTHLLQLAKLTGAQGKQMWGNSRNPVQMQVTPWDAEHISYEQILREICRITGQQDSDLEFDPLWYAAGMERYGNRPLVEPAECVEELALHNLVIAIDTSGSCQEYASAFLGLTVRFLKEAGIRKNAVWVVQCDTELRDIKEMDPANTAVLFETQEMCGGGGTDFRPVFRWIREMREVGEMDKPAALIYFSDGFGEFPDTEPDYKTIFVFPSEEEAVSGKEWVPEWVMKCCLTGEELKMTEEKEELIWNRGSASMK